MLEREIALAWAKKLRDPSLKQNKGRLNDGGGKQCCLDVLCEMQGAELKDLTGMKHQDGIYRFYGNSESEVSLPYDLAAVLHVSVNICFPLSISDTDMKIDKDDTISHVSVSAFWLNDEAELTFNQIADMIEYFADWLE